MMALLAFIYLIKGEKGRRGDFWSNGFFFFSLSWVSQYFQPLYYFACFYLPFFLAFCLSKYQRVRQMHETHIVALRQEVPVYVIYI